jgi:hypothetical protein
MNELLIWFANCETWRIKDEVIRQQKIDQVIESCLAGTKSYDDFQVWHVCQRISQRIGKMRLSQAKLRRADRLWNSIDRLANNSACWRVMDHYIDFYQGGG